LDKWSSSSSLSSLNTQLLLLVMIVVVKNFITSYVSINNVFPVDWFVQ
jgi:hypothetical protein